MRALVLTTQTSHHAYFVRQLSQLVSDLHVLSETAVRTAHFDTAHPFEAQRDRFEADCWFAGKVPVLASLAETVECSDANDQQIVHRVHALQPDVTLVFGTGKLRS